MTIAAAAIAIGNRVITRSFFWIDDSPPKEIIWLPAG
jgi:hypothetical protein